MEFLPRRNALALVGTAVLAAGAGLLASGCQQDGPFSETDLAMLRTFALSPLGPDGSNSSADVALAAKLGKQLYFDTRISGPLGPYDVRGTNGSLGNAGDTGKVGCISCHDPANGGSDHRSQPAATSLGAGYTPRNSPTVINAAYAPLWQFWDGRVDSLWSQALAPPEGANECNGSRLAVAHLIATDYAAAYVAIFGPLPDISGFPASGKPGDPAFDGLTSDDQKAINRIFANFGKAIAAYERRLVSPAFSPSPFDEFLAGKSDSLSPAAMAGAKIFIGRGGCAECHRGPLFSDLSFHNIGAPQEGEHAAITDVGRYDGIAAVQANPFNRGSEFSDERTNDHLTGLTAGDDDIGRFKTPTLRNVSKTAPYMHDGAYPGLWDVVNHYNFGGETGLYSGDTDPAINPLLLSNEDLDNLIEFLGSLADGDPLPTADFPEGLTANPQP